MGKGKNMGVFRYIAMLKDGSYLGIEEVYTLVGDKQVNIPVKVEQVREMGRNNELFCPCGCGANLLLVASDRQLRRQHFRIKDSDNEKTCSYATKMEGPESINAKIILKCWLDHVLSDKELEMRVPIHDVDDIDRKYEFSFLSRTRKLAVDFCRSRFNLSDEKLKILEDNSQGLKLFHIVGDTNIDTGGQYPEYMTKIQSQEKQGYCLVLNSKDKEYNDAELSVILYFKTPRGLWTTFAVITDKLKNFVIDNQNHLVYCPAGSSPTFVYERVLQAKIECNKKYNEELEQIRKEEELERQRRELEAKQQEEERQRKARQLEERQRWEEQRRRELVAEQAARNYQAWQQEQYYNKAIQQIDETENIYNNELSKLQNDSDKAILRQQYVNQLNIIQNGYRDSKQVRNKITEALARIQEDLNQDFLNTLATRFNQQEEQVKGPDGTRYIKCEVCGRIAPTKEFSSYGGRGHINLGICEACESQLPTT